MFTNNRIIKTAFRTIVTLFLLVIVFTTSLVYAEAPTKMTLVAEDITNSNEAPTLIGTLQSTVSETVVSTTISESKTPLVQSLTMSASSTESLFQDADYDSFFEHSVFVGDSISVGFSNYCQRTADSIQTDTTYFLAKESCSATVAISSKALTTYKSIMPVYNGQVQYIEDSIAQMPDIEKVFICFGINDLVGNSPMQYIENMTVLVERILEKSPDVTIYIISIPCIVEEAESGSLNNTTIQEANTLLESTCASNQWGFINLTEYLMNQNLAISPEYSSDGFVHQNSSAYAVWTKVLRNYAFEGMTR